MPPDNEKGGPQAAEPVNRHRTRADENGSATAELVILTPLLILFLLLVVALRKTWDLLVTVRGPAVETGRAASRTGRTS